MSGPGAEGRLLWTDAAKGLAIVLVVLHHAVVFADAAGWLPAAVVNLNLELAAFRMPLFFLAAGLFAASALARPWRVVWRRRLMLWAWLYVLWALLRLGFFAVVPDVRGAERVEGAADLVELLLVPQSGLWFLYALAAFSVLAKATRRVPPPVQLVLAAVLAALVTSGVVAIESVGWRGMGAYYLFFLLGMHASGWIRVAAARATVPPAISLTLLAVGVTAAITQGDLGGVPGVFLLQACAALAAGVGLSVVVAPTGVGRVLQALGTRTLPVYLVHVLWIGAGVAVIEAVARPEGLVGVVLVLGLVVSGVLVGLAAHALALRTGLTWLFEVPRRSSGAGWSSSPVDAGPASSR